LRCCRKGVRFLGFFSGGDALGTIDIQVGLREGARDRTGGRRVLSDTRHIASRDAV
jgi:hypothetical protein